MKNEIKFNVPHMVDMDLGLKFNLEEREVESDHWTK